MMGAPVSEFERALLAFRREHGRAYLKRLAGGAREPHDARARAWLCSERGLEQLAAAQESGELAPTHYAALAAHTARALAESRYEAARDATMGLLAREVAVEGETRALGDLLGVWSGSASPSPRARALASMEPELARFAEQLLRARAGADHAVAELLAKLKPPRHADAGPEGGSATEAERWLADSDEVAHEALAYVRHALNAEGQGGFDALWIALGQEFRGLFPREGRFRRLASDWEPLGLRRLLTARARAAPEHPGPFLAPHVIALAIPHELRVSASAREYGLASELANAEAIGRVLGHVHASEVLSAGLRFAPVATVARATGALAVQRLLEPRFLRRVRGLSARESEVAARAAALYFLLDSRLAAASVLARRSAGPEALDVIAALGERALLGSGPRGALAALLVRFAPGGPFRAKVHAPALVWALRERYDEDWYLNPRASEPLRGALTRAGELAVEDFAVELAADRARSTEKLAELF